MNNLRANSLRRARKSKPGHSKAASAAKKGAWGKVRAALRGAEAKGDFDFVPAPPVRGEAFI